MKLNIYRLMNTISKMAIYVCILYLISMILILVFPLYPKNFLDDIVGFLVCFIFWLYLSKTAHRAIVVGYIVKIFEENENVPLKIEDKYVKTIYNLYKESLNNSSLIFIRVSLIYILDAIEFSEMSKHKYLSYNVFKRVFTKMDNNHLCINYKFNLRGDYL